MWPFTPGDHPDTVTVGTLDQVGDLQDLSATMWRAVGVARWGPMFFLGQQQPGTDPVIDR